MLWQDNFGFSIGYDGTAIAVDPNGGVYVIPEIQPSNISVYVAKLNANGTGIAWTKQVTPSGMGLGNPVITADARGRVYVAGKNANGPNGPPPQGSAVIRLNAAGTTIDYTAEVAGAVNAIAVVGSGGAFVTGSTTVPFLARISPDGSLGFNTALTTVSVAGTIAFDPNGNPVVYCTVGNSSSGVVLRFDSTGSITLSTPVGSSTASVGGPSNFALDTAGNAYITGSSYLYDSGVPYLFPVNNSLATCGAEWLSVYAPDGSLLQATYVPSGGESIVQAPLVATGPNSTVFVVHSSGTGFTPTQAGPFPSGSLSFLWRLSPNANAPTFPLACLGNSATYLTGSIAPGGLVTLFGSTLGPQQGVQPKASLQTPFPTQTASMQVTSMEHPRSALGPKLTNQCGRAVVSDARSVNAGMRDQQRRKSELRDLAGRRNGSGGVHVGWCSRGGAKSGWERQFWKQSRSAEFHRIGVRNRAGSDHSAPVRWCSGRHPSSGQRFTYYGWVHGGESTLWRHDFQPIRSHLRLPSAISGRRRQPNQLQAWAACEPEWYLQWPAEH
jgi:hypothetical protein